MSHPHAAELPADQMDDWPPHAPETFHELDRIGKAATVLLGLSTVTHLLSTWSDWHTYGVVNKYLGGAPNVEDADLNRADALARLTSVPNVVLSVAAAVVFVLWLWRARLNSEVFCQADHRRSHGWVLTSWFCPGANLFYPKQIVDDVWVASHPDTPVWADELPRRRRSTVVTGWWLCWLGAMLLDVAVRRVLMWVDPTVPVLRAIAMSATVSVILTGISAWLATVIIRRVSWMQTSRPWIPWWDHREDLRPAQREAPGYAERPREAAYADRPHAGLPYAEAQQIPAEPELQPMLAATQVFAAPTFQAAREPQMQLASASRAELESDWAPAARASEPNWSEPRNWSEQTPVGPESALPSWSGPTRSELSGPPERSWSDPPAGSSWSDPPAAPSWVDSPPVAEPPPAPRWAEPPARPEPRTPSWAESVLNDPPAADPFDRPWLRDTDRPAETVPHPAPAAEPEPEPEPEAKAASWSPFAAIVEGWREQIEGADQPPTRQSASYLESPGYLSPTSSYLEPSDSIAPPPPRFDHPANPPRLSIVPPWQDAARRANPQAEWRPAPPPQTEPTPEPTPEPTWRSEPTPEPTWRSEPTPEPSWRSEPTPEPTWRPEPTPEPEWSSESVPWANHGPADPPAPVDLPAPVTEPWTDEPSNEPWSASASWSEPSGASRGQHSGPVVDGPAAPGRSARHSAKPASDDPPPFTPEPPGAGAYVSAAPVVPGPPPAPMPQMPQMPPMPRPETQPAPRPEPRQPIGDGPRPSPRRRWTAG